MIDAENFEFDYDAEGDVLYISVSHDVAVRGVEDDLGIVWRFGSEGRLVGLTVLDAHDRWMAEDSALKRRILERVPITPEQAHAMLA